MIHNGDWGRGVIGVIDVTDLMVGNVSLVDIFSCLAYLYVLFPIARLVQGRDACKKTCFLRLLLVSTGLKNMLTYISCNTIMFGNLR